MLPLRTLTVCSYGTLLYETLMVSVMCAAPSGTMPVSETLYILLV